MLLHKMASASLLITALAVGCSDQPNPTALADGATAPSLSVAAPGVVGCMLPVAMPDRWVEIGGPGNDPMRFNPELDDYFDPTTTGYSDADRGLQLVFSKSSWVVGWLPPDQNGHKNYLESIRSCVDGLILGIGDRVDIVKGGVNLQTLRAFRDLIAQDPNVVWDPIANCVLDESTSNCLDRGSPRIRTVPLFSPVSGPEGNDKQFNIADVVAVFVEEVGTSGLVVRFVGR